LVEQTGTGWMEEEEDPTGRAGHPPGGSEQEKQVIIACAALVHASCLQFIRSVYLLINIKPLRKCVSV